MRFARVAALATVSPTVLAAPLAAGAQPAQKVHRIGILSPSPASSSRVEAIREGLRSLGYVEGRNLAIERRDAKAEADLPALAAELVRLGVDLIVTGGSASIGPAMQATTAIPIVIVADNTDPVVAGYVASYARPWGERDWLDRSVARRDREATGVLEGSGTRHVTCRGAAKPHQSGP
jgi:putative ABC transport system substrate-binding protein